jgi:hypothetical protein
MTSSYTRYLLLCLHVGAPMIQHSPEFNKHILTVWLDKRINFLNQYHTERHWFQLYWEIQRDVLPSFHFYESCSLLGQLGFSCWKTQLEIRSSRYLIISHGKEESLKNYAYCPGNEFHNIRCNFLLIHFSFVCVPWQVF